MCEYVYKGKCIYGCVCVCYWNSNSGSHVCQVAALSMSRTLSHPMHTLKKMHLLFCCCSGVLLACMLVHHIQAVPVVL